MFSQKRRMPKDIISLEGLTVDTIEKENNG
jgi:hypothetical protein